MRFIALTLLSCFFLHPAIASNCRFEQQADDYICILIDITSADIDTQSGTHLNGHSHADVTIVKSEFPYGQLEILKKTIFEDFPNLREVFLDHLEISSIESDALGFCDELQVFSVEFNQLSAIDGGIFNNCGKLKEIHMGFNEIDIFPMNLVATLEVLNLRGNNITNIPILSNSDLIELNLSNNLINSVDENAFKDLKKLKNLDLTSNRLTDFNGNFPELLNLILTDNYLTNVTITAPKVEILDLSDNELSNFEFLNLSQMQKLKILNLGKNWLQNFNFPRLENLHKLILDNNEIKFIAENQKPFENLINLKFLSLAGNFMTYMGSDSLDGLQKLETLNLNTNYLSFLAINEGNSLKILNLDDNKFTNLTELPESLEILTLARNLLENIEFNGLKNLKELNLNTNFIQKLLIGVFSPLEKLEKLNLSHNQLRVIDLDAFQRTFFFLNEVQLRFNEIQAIESNLLRKMPNLKIFDASSNPCVKMTINSISQMENCFENFKEFMTTTSTSEYPTTEAGNLNSNRKDLMMSIVTILAIACLLFALIYYIHGIILLREKREVVRGGAMKGNNPTLPNYDRF